MPARCAQGATRGGLRQSEQPGGVLDHDPPDVGLGQPDVVEAVHEGPQLLVGPGAVGLAGVGRDHALPHPGRH